MNILSKLFNKFCAEIIGRKVFTNNPYLGFIIEANDEDLIADEFFTVGLAYKEGLYFLPQDTNKAISYFRKAAERGHAPAQVMMAMASMKSNDDSNPEVMEWLTKAANQGERQAMYNLGISYHRGDINGLIDIAKSNELFRKSAEAGYQPSAERMALVYLNGDGVEKNEAIAKFWALMAYYADSDSNNQTLLHQLAATKGFFSEEEISDGHINENIIINNAAKAGEREAICRQGYSQLDNSNEEEALKAWKTAATLGHPVAMVNLARRMMRDDTKDYEGAFKYYKEAAEIGNEGALFGLAFLYYNGYGVKQDIATSWRYLEKALNLGNNDARQLFAHMCLHNELQEIIPDKVMRGMNYADLAQSKGEQ